MLAKSRTESETSRMKWESSSITKISAFPIGFMFSRPAGRKLFR